jgi:hypothetical protein
MMTLAFLALVMAVIRPPTPARSSAISITMPYFTAEDGISGVFRLAADAS